MFDSATQILASIRKSDLSSIEVSAEHLNHIEQINPKINGKKRFYTDILIWAGLANCTQLPATNIPLGFSKSGLPISMQAMGPYLEDKTTIEFAKLVSKITSGFVVPPE